MSDLPGPRRTTSLRARGSPLATPASQRARLGALGLEPFDHRLTSHQLSLYAGPVRTLQLNLGRLCNMTCAHCHVDAGPDRVHENMSEDTVRDALALIKRTGAKTLDLTGGAPELHPRFRDLVDAGVAAGMHVIDRCNLTVLLVPRCADLPAWFAERGVEVVASLPHWRKPNTDAQRGEGTFERSIEALRRLNAVGYGTGDEKRLLTLMHNPAGAWLPPAQATLEREWKDGLARTHGVHFDRLITLNNMPIARYLDWLDARGETEAYVSLLTQAFNPATVAGLMCRDTLSVSWDGRLYDCDFNQMLDIPSDLRDPTLTTQDDLAGRRINTGPHCYGCTAGSGSSCGGATT